MMVKRLRNRSRYDDYGMAVMPLVDEVWCWGLYMFCEDCRDLNRAVSAYLENQRVLGMMCDDGDGSGRF